MISDLTLIDVLLAASHIFHVDVYVVLTELVIDAAVNRPLCVLSTAL